MTGIRRISYSSIAAMALERSSSSRQTIIVCVITSPTVVLLGSLDSATTLMAKSRSVTMPIISLVLSSLTTGTGPMWSRLITRATWLTESLGRQQTGFSVMTSLHFIPALLGII